jgi:hypothetical protein
LLFGFELASIAQELSLEFSDLVSGFVETAGIGSLELFKCVFEKEFQLFELLVVGLSSGVDGFAVQDAARSHRHKSSVFFKILSVPLLEAILDVDLVDLGEGRGVLAGEGQLFLRGYSSMSVSISRNGGYFAEGLCPEVGVSRRVDDGDVGGAVATGGGDGECVHFKIYSIFDSFHRLNPDGVV